MNGSWGTVAIFPAVQVAEVVCRQLGYGGGAVRGGNFYGGGTTSAQAAPGAELPPQFGLSCQGNETNLNQCSWSLAGIGDVLGVACDGEQGWD